MLKQLKTSLIMLGAMTLITGVLYPLLITGLAQMMFPRQANGSLIQAEGRLVGSELIGQSFDDPAYFWGRLSATSPFPYNAGASSGSNLGPSNPALTRAAQSRIQALLEADPNNDQAIPVDLVTSSGSGLDPHISVAAALYQVPRIARLRGIPEDRLRALVEAHTEARLLGFLGELRINVLELNLALDGIQ